MGKKSADKFEPLTNVKPVENANEEIDLKEKDPQTEPQYLEDKDAPPDEPATSTADYAKYTKPGSDKEPRSWKVPIIIILVLLIAGAAGYWFLLRTKPAATTKTTSTTKTSPTATTPAATTEAKPISTTTKSYESTNFKLTFSYPDDWVVADAGGGVLTVKSSNVSLKNAAGQTVTGLVVFTIRDKTQKLTEFDKGNSTATRDSLKITYAKPTQTQRGSTYLSYLRYAGDTTAGALDGIYITSDNGYKKDQAIPLVDVAKVDPSLAITFADANSKAMSIADTMLDDAAFAKTLTNIFTSLSIN